MPSTQVPKTTFISYTAAEKCNAALFAPNPQAMEFHGPGTRNGPGDRTYLQRHAQSRVVDYQLMEKATPTSDMTNWVETFIAMSGFPVLLEQDPLPALRSWNYLGKLPGLAKKLKADEAHAYTGLANYSEGSRTELGRLYILMARRKSFAWKIALSFETACFEGMPEEKVYANDHVRAGAILGNLCLAVHKRRRK